MNQNFLANNSLRQFLEEVDEDLACKCQEAGCARCGSKLHCDKYPRKPRGGPAQWNRRHSFTCADKRHRTTPPSVRFLGPKVYISVVVILVSAMTHGLSPKRITWLKEHLQIDRRTLAHWREWWRDHFTQGPFWKGARARLMPPVTEGSLPLELCERFGVERMDRLLELLKFLMPITTGSCLCFKEIEGG